MQGVGWILAIIIGGFVGCAAVAAIIADGIGWAPVKVRIAGNGDWIELIDCGEERLMNAGPEAK